MKTYIFQSFIILSILSLCACSNSSKEIPADSCCAPTFNTIKKTDTHDEHNNETTLTNIQLENAGITIGDFANKPLTGSIKANGHIVALTNSKAFVSSLSEGVVDKIYVMIGTKVSKGQTIATIVNNNLLQMQENYLTTNSQLKLAEIEYERQLELSKANAGIGKNLQQAQAELQILKIKHSSLKQQLAILGIQTNQLNASNIVSQIAIKSPINGVITQINTQTGSYINTNTPIAEVIDNTQLQLELRVFERDLAYLKKDQTIDFKVTNIGDKTFKAKIHNISTSINESDHSIPIYASILTPNTFLAGMSVTALIYNENFSGLIVPSSALITEGEKYYIYIQVSSNDKEQTFKQIEVLKSNETENEIAIQPLETINNNIKVVTKGAFYIHAKLKNASGEEESSHAH